MVSQPYRVTTHQRYRNTQQRGRREGFLQYRKQPQRGCRNRTQITTSIEEPFQNPVSCLLGTTPQLSPDSKCKAAVVSHQHWLWGNSHRGWPGVGKAWKHQPFGSALAHCLGSPSFEAPCPVRRQELRFSLRLAKIKTENHFGVGGTSPESRVSQSLFSHQKILVRLENHQKNDTFGHQKQQFTNCKIFSASGLR